MRRVEEGEEHRRAAVLRGTMSIAVANFELGERCFVSEVPCMRSPPGDNVGAIAPTSSNGLNVIPLGLAVCCFYSVIYDSG